MVVFKRNRKKYFIVKTSGGVASQFLALMSAIHISTALNRPFKIKHYPYSTGGYYPIGIVELLSQDEIFDTRAQIAGMKNDSSENVGAILESHPLIARKFSYLHFLNFLHKLGLDKLINVFRLEWQIDTNINRLLSSPRFLRTVSGGYPPFYSFKVEEKLKERFEGAGKRWPFISHIDNSKSPDVVIHVRLGDKRTAFSKPGIGGAVNAVIDPTSYKEILDSLPKQDNRKIYVISDEPQLAVSLLASVGISALPSGADGDLWKDLELMSSGRVLICPWSTVSQLVAVFVSQQAGKQVYYPTSPGVDQKKYWDLPKVTYYQPKYLAKDHPIYVETYLSNVHNGTSYIEKNLD